ncbi:PIN domain-containing protein [Actinomyces sp.]|uniref:PIN domain-containing protein n=1 Tax=Actinomyces sp. TaxID=29317 RepID=UPI0026DD1F95|nr:PIN domain-containing protein [Actinomyces sp.]MDO4899689.1 PIN domain-containing protein [Actinomyces sp.]
MTVLLDTNVVSEGMKPDCDPAVLSFLESAGHEFFLSTITVFELLNGVKQLPDGHRRKQLERSIAAVLESYSFNTLAIDSSVSSAAAEASAERRSQGRPADLADLLIAGTCLANGLTLATRNVKDFTGITGLTVVNPFERSETRLPTNGH